MWNLRQQLDRQKEQHDSIVRGHKETENLIQRFSLLPNSMGKIIFALK